MVPLHVQLTNSTLRRVIKRLHFPLEVMLVCVRWYAAYPLSLRNLEEMMAERDLARACAARRRFRLPEVFAVPALERLRQPRLPAALADSPDAASRGAAQGKRGRAHAAHRRQVAKPGDPPFGWSDAAHRDRPRPGAEPLALSDGRTTLLARRQAAQRSAP